MAPHLNNKNYTRVVLTNIDGSRHQYQRHLTGYWGPLLETIAKKESVGGSYDSIYPGTTKQKRYGGKH